MSLRRADVRFALPQAAATAVVLGGLEAWAEGLRQAGVETTTARGAAAPDLVVAPANLRDAALDLNPAMLVVEGARSTLALRRAGWTASLVQPLPDADRPELVLPLGDRRATRYALRRWRPGRSRLTRARTALAREALAHGLPVPGRAPTALGSQTAGPPFVVAPALELLGLRDAASFAAFGRWAHPFSRGAYYLFGPGREPGWVVKFARLPGIAHLFEDDERGLRLAEEAGGLVASHAPRLIARYEVAGLHASVETAAPGRRLGDLLESGAPRDERLAAVDRIASWIVAVARETATSPDALVAERRRLASAVLPRWSSHGVSAELVDALPPLAAVFQHGDLSPDNLLVHGTGFTAVDWESARPDGLPLWDLFYFLTHALALADRVSSEDERAEHFVRLWRGELPSSRLAFRLTREAAAASGVPAGAVGPLVTLLWLSYAALDSAHVERVAAVAGEPADEPATMQLARRWLSEPGLGPDWSGWA